ncbi:lactase/phlorizin hydrolase-like [Diorhabda carinulata]|uniref:lactase/phlorizin hydrolase-like n=1 Tax=Diorhabda carinulata TaxID=1163345 RepID=UPI0025A28C81|nr:lactase/phlorizin hydrolase-like [Diorhabda carinulata]
MDLKFPAGINFNVKKFIVEKIYYKIDVNRIGFSLPSASEDARNAPQTVKLLASAHFKNNGKFPKHFIFGASTSAYQIEGAWNVDGKGESIWDHFVHQKPSQIFDNSTGDVACDSYHKYEEDVGLAANLGISLYRFSISWSRVLPTGYSNVINERGLQYYKNLVKEIRSRNMIPAATIYHFDLPQKLFEDGIDWRNPKLVNHFENYARIIIRSLPEVGVWFTINEPRQICLGGYAIGFLAPAIDGDFQYQCNYVLLKAHAAVYHMYKTEFPHYKAEMGLVVDCDWMEPKSNSSADKAAAERQLQFECGMYFHPIYSGDWPDIVKERVYSRSIKTNITKPRLPVFTQEEIVYIKGTHDFLGINHYYTSLTQDEAEAPYNESSYAADLRVADSFDPSWLDQSNGYFTVPFGVYKILKWLKQEYDNPKILITEIGMTDDGTNLNDEARIDFYKDYFCYILEAIREGVDVQLISFWSLIDTFEWLFGYSEMFQCPFWTVPYKLH